MWDYRSCLLCAQKQLVERAKNFPPEFQLNTEKNDSTKLSWWRCSENRSWRKVPKCCWCVTINHKSLFCTIDTRTRRGNRKLITAWMKRGRGKVMGKFTERSRFLLNFTQSTILHSRWRPRHGYLGGLKFLLVLVFCAIIHPKSIIFVHEERRFCAATGTFVIVTWFLALSSLSSPRCCVCKWKYSVRILIFTSSLRPGKRHIIQTYSILVGRTFNVHFCENYLFHLIKHKIQHFPWAREERSYIECDNEKWFEFQWGKWGRNVLSVLMVVFEWFIQDLLFVIFNFNLNFIAYTT